MVSTALPKNKISIRLTEERWQHITTGHPEMADYYYEILETIENPEKIYAENFDGKIAVSKRLAYINKYIVVIYKEVSLMDGFVITAYYTDNVQSFNKKELLWKEQ